MESIIVRTDPSYEAVTGAGLLSEAGPRTAAVTAGSRVLIASDDRVAPLYLEIVSESFRQAGFRTASFVFPAGEGSKNLQTVEEMLNAADQAELTRNDVFAALGGGVTGDLTGLAAALYQRGTDFIQLPTTLLAMVDASVGGKTAVNLRNGKNLCGAFHQPRLVLCDTDTLDTLPEPVFAEGMAEVIKHGALSGGEMLNRLEAGENPKNLIADNIRFKAEIVRQDERENGLRQLLNFGHTFGHALEKLNQYGIYHGEGVAVGMLIAARAAEEKGICTPGVFGELRELLAAQDLPVATAFSAAQVARAAMNDKKRRGDTITLVLPEARGRCALVKTAVNDLEDMIRCCDGEVTGR